MSLRTQILARNVFSHTQNTDIIDPYHTRNASTNAYVMATRPKTQTAHHRQNHSGWAQNNNNETATNSPTAKRTTPFRTNYAFSFKSKKESRDLAPKSGVSGLPLRNGFVRNNEVKSSGTLLVKEPTTKGAYRSPVEAMKRNLRPMDTILQKDNRSGFTTNFPDLQHAPEKPGHVLVHSTHPVIRAQIKKRNSVNFQEQAGFPKHFLSSYKRGFSGTSTLKSVDIEMAFNVEGFTIPAGSSSRQKFRDWLIADLSNILNVDKKYFKIQDIIPKSQTVVQLTILPTEGDEKDATEIGEALADMVDDTDSALYKGSVTANIVPQSFYKLVFSPDEMGKPRSPSRKKLISGYGRRPEFRDVVFKKDEDKPKPRYKIEGEKHRNPTNYLHISCGSPPWATNNKLWHKEISMPKYKIVDKDSAFMHGPDPSISPKNRTATMQWTGYDKEGTTNQAKQTAFTQNFHLETTKYHTGADGPRKTLKGLVAKRTTHEGLYQRSKQYNRRVRSEAMMADTDDVSNNERYTSTYSRNQVRDFRGPPAPLKNSMKFKSQNRTGFQASNTLNAPWNGGTNVVPDRPPQGYVNPKVERILHAIDPLAYNDRHAHKMRR